MINSEPLGSVVPGKKKLSIPIPNLPFVDLNRAGRSSIRQQGTTLKYRFFLSGPILAGIQKTDP